MTHVTCQSVLQPLGEQIHIMGKIQKKLNWSRTANGKEWYTCG